MPSKRPRVVDKPKESPSREWWIRGTEETCDFFGISAVTLNAWYKKGAPKLGYGKWDVRALIDWKYKEGHSAEKRKLEAEATLKETKAEQEKIKLKIQEGKYIEAAKVTADLRRLFSSLRKSFLALGHNVATELNSYDPDIALEANKVIDETVNDALKQLAEGKTYGSK